MIKTYYAGKISKNGWREELYKELRDMDFSNRDNKKLIYSNLEYSGPFFIGCDHGCFHGDNSHGVLPYDGALCEGSGEVCQEEVVDYCYKWINKSDAIFCYINSEECYGTMTEIGYAYAKHKPIFMVINNDCISDKFLNDIWFLIENADEIVYENNITQAHELYLNWASKFFKYNLEKNKIDDEVFELFDYYNKSNKTGFKSLLSSFISHSEFLYKNKSTHEVISITELNNLDRETLADAFWKQKTHDYKYTIHGFYTPTRDVSEVEVKQHMIEYIDLVIPRHYFVLLEEQRLGKYIDRSTCRKKYRNILDIDGLKFVYFDNYEREGTKNKVTKEKIKFNKEYANLNYPYEKYNDEILFKMVVKDAEDAGYELIKRKDEINRFDLLRLLHFFYRDTEMDDLFDFVQYED